jgi:hypothetical protein
MSELYNADINKGIFYAKIEKFQRIKMIFHLSIGMKCKGFLFAIFHKKKWGSYFQRIPKGKQSLMSSISLTETRI